MKKYYLLKMSNICMSLLFLIIKMIFILKYCIYIKNIAYIYIYKYAILNNVVSHFII